MNKLNSQGRSVITQARSIAKSLGIVVAAKYLKGKGCSVEGAVWILLRK